MFLIVIGWST